MRNMFCIKTRFGCVLGNQKQTFSVHARTYCVIRVYGGDYEIIGDYKVIEL